jgi:hypothetical protein
MRIHARRATAALLAWLALPLAATLAQPPPTGGGDDGARAPDEKPELRVVTDDEAKAALERFAVIVKSGDDLALRPAIEGLGDWPHPLVAAEVEKHFGSKDTDVKLAALKALSRWNAELSGSTLQKAFKSKKNAENPKLYAAIIEAVGATGTKVSSKALLDLVPIDAARQDPHVVKAAITVLGKMKEKKAVDLFIKIFEVDPNDQPSNPGPNDPPASYWKAVWERWQAVEPALKQALTDITGETFANGKEAREWYRKNKARLRIP